MTTTDQVAREIIAGKACEAFSPEQQAALKDMAEYYLGLKAVAKLWGPLKALATILGTIIGLWLSFKAGILETFIALVKGGGK